jgi:hypothetical protein|tara:strand:+ start:180 stop:353 length:174 start_codon:yes stop_codon:yes gene_type:complete
MPETKKINEVEKVVKDILDRVIHLETNSDTIINLKKDRDLWKKKYDDLKTLYDKTWI